MLSVSSLAQLYAKGRNYASAAAGAALMLGVTNAAQNKTLTESLNEVFTGLSMVYHGATSIWQLGVILATPLVGWYMARKAGQSAQPENQVATAVAAAKDTSDPKKAEAVQVLLANGAVQAGAEKVVNPGIADNPATLPQVVSK